MAQYALPISVGLRVRLTLMRHVVRRYGWIGVLIGYAFMTFYFLGGEDAYYFYMRPYWPGATAPAWVFALTAPAASLPWPLPWTALVIVSIIGAVWAQRAFGEHRWWFQLFNYAFVANLGQGQIEIVTMAGVALAWLVIQRKAHPAWFGIALLGLLTKVQVGVGLAALFTFWIWREQGWRTLIWAAGAALAVIGVTLVLYPGWPGHYLEALRNLAPQDSSLNASVLPWGLAAIPLALIPLHAGKLRRARMVAAATLLASPYFTWYHPATPMLLETRGALVWLSWLEGIPRIFFGYERMGWITITAILVWDVWHVVREWRRSKSEAVLTRPSLQTEE